MNDSLEAKKNQLKEELEKLNIEFKIELPKIIAKARSYGDLKENAEYHAARERQSFVKAHIARCNEQLGKLSSLNMSDVPDDRIGYGSDVTVVDLDTDDRISFKIVTSDEVNPSEGKISMTSPIGIALKSKSPGEVVEALIPAGKRKYFIEKLITIHGNVFESAAQ